MECYKAGEVSKEGQRGARLEKLRQGMGGNAEENLASFPLFCRPKPSNWYVLENGNLYSQR